MSKIDDEGGPSGSGAADKRMTVFQTQMSEFSPGSQQFNEWLERLEIYFVDIRETLESAKRATLLRTIGIEPYSILKAICDPELPVNKSYDKLCEMLDTHNMSPVNIYRERLNFYIASKGTDETVSQWYARVKALALKCKFKAT